MSSQVPHVRASESGLSYSQLPIWIGQQRTPDSPLYNMAFAFVFEGAIDTEVFCAAWRQTVVGSDALQTRVVERGGAVVRHCGEPDEYETGVEDLSSHSDPETQFRAWARERCARVLPMGGPLVDSVLVRLRPDRWGWYLNQHHLVTDASATVALFRTVADAYGLQLSRGSAGTPRPSYYTTIEQLAAYPGAGARALASAHWRERTSADRTVPFYGECPRAASTRSERLTVILGEEASRRIRALGAEAGFVSLTRDISIFSIFATLLTAWCHRVSGSTIISLDALAHGRPTPAARNALGPFIERFPFTVSIASGESFRSLGAKCLAETLALLRHALPATAASAGASAGNVVLNYLSQRFGDFAGVPVRAEWIHPRHSDAVHAVRLQVHDFEGTGLYTLHFDVNEDAFTPGRRLRLVAHFQRILDAFLANPDAAVAFVDVLTPEERDSLLVRFNATAARPLPTASVVERFERQAARTPERIALRQGERVTTFAALQREVAAAAERSGAARRGAGGPGGGVHQAIGRGGRCHPRRPEGPERCTCRSTRRIQPPAWLTSWPTRGGPLIGQGDATPQLPASRPPLVSIAQLQPVGRSPIAMPIELPALDDLAYVIYTSGSTGRAEGRAGRARRAGRLPRMGGTRVRPRRSSGVSAVHVARLRPDGHEPVPAAHDRRHAGHLPGARRARSTRR